MKVAIVHDWFVGWGAEQVVYELHKMYPDAPIYTAYCNQEWLEQLQPAKVITSYMQHWPFSKLRKFLPVLRALWFSRLDLSGYVLVISSSGAEAKAVRVKKPAIHVNYCHAPTHYYWSRYEEYMKRPGFGLFDPLAKLGLKLLVGPMHRWDRRAAQRPDYLIANSNHIKQQIKKYYGRESTVIHPPVDTKHFKPLPGLKRRGFVTAGRQVPYKRIDLAVDAATQLSLPLKVASDGPEHTKLVASAGPSIEFKGILSAKEMAELFASAEGFIMPGLDDFGIVAVEALATGTPVIAYGHGGALDYVNHKTGLLFSEPTVASLEAALRKFKPTDYDASDLAKTAEQFSPTAFRKSMTDFIQRLV